jgi:hypothetical protein
VLLLVEANNGDKRDDNEPTAMRNIESNTTMTKNEIRERLPILIFLSSLFFVIY